MTPSSRATVFDLDDTLYLERDFARSGYQVVAAQFADRLGPPDHAVAAMLRQLDSPNRRRVFDAALADLGLAPDPQLIQRMIETYRNHAPQIQLCADADRILSRLRGTTRIGLITDGPRETQSAKIHALGLQTRIDAIILTADLGAGFNKPHPRAYEKIAEMLNVAPTGCTYVADNPAKDFVAPNALGWTTIQIIRPGGFYAAESAPPQGAARRLIHSLDELQ